MKSATRFVVIIKSSKIYKVSWGKQVSDPEMEETPVEWGEFFDFLYEKKPQDTRPEVHITEGHTDVRTYGCMIILTDKVGY